MIALILVLLGTGALLSALFSGCETGFYRVTRFRLVLDGLEGDWISRMLLRLTNHPALFVATLLIGNNAANYLVSLGIVLAVQTISGDSQSVELTATILLSPLVFVYCEYLPKQMYFHAPNRLLRRSGPVLLLFTVLLAPITAVLWGLGWLLEKLVGQTPLRIKLTLARQELQEVLDEGQEAGILYPVQRQLAQRLFANASQDVMQFGTPLHRVAAVPLGADKGTALRLARRQQQAVVPVRQADGESLVGYVRVIDLLLDASTKTVTAVRPLMRLRRTESHLTALMMLQAENVDLALIEDLKGNPVGVLFRDQLIDPLLQPN
jgi:putative hemolysin